MTKEGRCLRKKNPLYNRDKLRYFPYLLLIAFLFIIFIAYKLALYSYIFLLLFISIGISVFIIIDFSKLDARALDELHWHFDAKSCKNLFNIFFLICYMLSLISLLYGEFTKILPYYFFISICSGLLAIEIEFGGNSKGYISILAKIFMLGLNISGSNQILYAGIGGADSYYHIYNLLIPTLTNGYIPSGTIYSYFPGHIIFVEMAELLTLIDPFKGYYYIISLVSPISIFFIYLAGKRFFSQKFGLFAALLSQISSFIISWQSHPFQTTYALPLATIIYFLVLELAHQHRSSGPQKILLFIICSVALTFSHHHTSLIIFLIILFISIYEIIIKLRTKSNLRNSIKGLLFTYAIVMLTQWIFNTKFLIKILNIFSIYFEAFQKLEVASPLKYDTLIPNIIFLNTLGMCLFMLFSTIGILHILKVNNLLSLTAMITSIFLSFSMAFGIMSGTGFLAPQRLFTYMQQFGLVFLASIGIFYILNYLGKKFFNSNIIKAFAVAAIIFNVAFFSASSNIAGFETSPFVYGQSYLKLFKTLQEVQSEDWIETHVQISESSIYKSGSYYTYIHQFANVPSSILYKEIPLYNNNINFTAITDGDFILFSKFDIICGFVTKLKAGKFGQTEYMKQQLNPFQDLLDYDKYYDNSISSVFKFQK